MIEIDEIFNNIDAHRVKNSREFFPLLFKLQIRLQDYKKKNIYLEFSFRASLPTTRVYTCNRLRLSKRRENRVLSVLSVL